MNNKWEILRNYEDYVQENKTNFNVYCLLPDFNAENPNYYDYDNGIGMRHYANVIQVEIESKAVEEFTKNRNPEDIVELRLEDL